MRTYTDPILSHNNHLRSWPGVCLASLAMMLVLSSSAQGQGLVYEDADIVFVNGVGNLAAADGNPDPFAIFNDDFSFPEADGVWDIRGAEDPNTMTSDNVGARPAGSTGQQSVFASGGRGQENSPELVQTISGLDASTSFDVYAVYWSAGNADWGVRAGFAENPGANQYFNRTGDNAGTVSAIAGTNGSAAAWTTLPGTNSDAGIFVEGNRTMYLGKIGTQSSDGSGNLSVYIDDLSTEEEGLGDVFRTWYEGLAYVAAGTDVTVRATIDRDTGALSIVNNTSLTIDVASYSITSAAGELDPTQWTSIAPGNNAQDTDAWVKSSELATDLSESEDPANDGFSLTGTFTLGDVWQKSPFEDTQITLTLIDDSEIVLSPEYTGTTFSDSFEIGDLNTNGNIGLDDYVILLDSLHAPIDTVVNDTNLELHALGDLNGDEAVNYSDIVQFRELFAVANPGVALELVGVPEPSALLLTGCGLFALGIFRKRRVPVLATTCLALVALLSLSATPAMAQISYVDADFLDQDTPGGNTTLSDGTPFIFLGDASGTPDPFSTDPINVAEYLLADAAPDNFGTPQTHWGERTRNGVNGGSVFVGIQGAGSDAPEIKTTITGLDQGTAYNIYAYYYTNGPGGANGNQNWSLSAGLNSGSLTAFDEDGVNGMASPAAVAGDFVGSVSLGSTETLRQALVGIAVPNASGEVDVFIDDVSTDTQRTWYDGVGFEEAVTLTLEVDRSTGDIKILNLEDEAFSIDYYEIRSEGSLNVSGWNSLDAQENDAPGVGWGEAGGISSTILSEDRAPGESNVELVANTGELDLGAGFSLGGAEDLDFFYALDNGALQTGIVSYINDPPASPPGDFDNDLDVDGADFLAWQRGDAPGGATDANLTLWQDNYGNPPPLSALSATAVPEPGTCSLALIALLVLVRSARTNTKDRF